MKTPLCILILIQLFALGANAQILRPFTARYYNASAKGSIVYVANSIVSTTGIGAGSPGTGEVPPGGTTKNGAAGIDIDIDNYTVSKLAFGSVWNYYASTTAPANDGGGRTWTNAAYVLPAGWNTGGVPVAGAGKYGYNASQTTCLRSSTVACGASAPCAPTTACNKYTAYYFRQDVNFTAAELSTTFQTIQLNVKRDDGIVIYINGVERAANNMPAGRTYATLASSNIAVGAAENVTFNLSPAFFATGANTIAVEIHTAAVQSADMSFDMEVIGLSDNGTHNSSSADLNLPSCSNVLFAGLYWGTGQGGGGANVAWITGETTCKLKLPGASNYTTITSTQTDYWNSTLITGYAHSGFECFKDITSLVNLTSPNGTYTIADVVSPVGISDAYGGWTLVIVYGNSSLPPQNLTVFDGCAAVKNGSGNVDVSINGFLTPASGPVSCELGTVVYDGDRSSTDGFQFKQNGAALFYDMATVAVPLNGAADAWNSKVSHKGAVVTTRNPAFNNTIGYDASIFDLPNSSNAQLSNSQTSGTVRFFSNSENVIVNVLTTAISQFNPTYSFEKTATDINGGTFLPGDSLLYKIKFTNQGNDSSTNTIILDNLPSGTAYIPGSIKIGTSTKTDGSGDDQAEYDFTNNRIVFRLGLGATSAAGGRIGPGQTDSVQFKVATTSSCAIIGCIGSVRNSARINYSGKLSGAALYDSSGVNTAGCIVQGPVINPLSGACATPADTVLANCTPSPILLPYAFYAGYTFYSAMPFIPANVYNQYTPIAASGTYWAYFSNGAGCTDTARIDITIASPSTGPSSISAPSTIVCNPTSVTLTAVGGTLGTSANYQWGTGAVVGTGPIAGATGSTLTVSPGVTTTYWVRIENTISPCASTTGGTTVTITVRQPSIAPTSITGADICSPGSTTLTAVGGTLGTSANYQWGTGSTPGTNPIGGATSSTLTVSPTVTTTYWVKIKNTTGPCADSTAGITKTITVSQPSAAPASVTGADICNGSSTTLTAIGGTLGTSGNYQWGTGSTPGANPIGGATSSTLTVSPTVTTTYWVKIKNTSSPCADSTAGVTKTITVSQPSAAPTSVTGADICNGSSTTLTAIGGTLGTNANYQWGTGSTPGTNPIGGATSSTLTVSPTVTTTYWVKIKNTSSPCADSTAGVTKTISVSQPSVAPTSVTGADFCNPGSTTLTALGGVLGTSANYQWGTGAVVGTSPIVGATSSTLTVSPVVTTTYWVRIENTAGPCAAYTSGLTKLITVSQPSVAAASASKNKNNICPGISVSLSVVGGTLGTGATWKWYTGACGTTLAGTGAGLTVTPLVTTTYYVRAEGSCNTTTCQAVTVTISCDIDKDKDGIPDWVESNIAAAFQDANANGLINAYDPTYPGFVDNNNDYINDNFQADGDSDNDGLPNYLDLDFPGRVDINNDGIDDRFDTDLDGKINMIDLDSDNDGVPDVVEAYGVDTNGDGKIDNYIDADGDGLSDQVDANLTNAYNSGTGLNRPDLDGDGVPNYLDLDSDNDGIPDIVEVGAPDTDNNGKVDGFTDVNGDGLHDGYINATALLITGTDTNSDGRADSYPNKNLDRDFRPNAYDVDADGDGIVDVIEAGLPDIDLNGIIDGAIAADGWSTSVSALAALNLRSTDGDGKPDYLDIDSDNDGIPDNIEGQSTANYKLPTLTDTDGDGLASPYDTNPGFSGSGIFVYDHDADGTPDYRDLDSDADGLPDIVEGNDFNLNGIADDNVTLTGLDTDGDGLDNRFDSLNSVTSIKGTSYRMGTNGSFTGDATPGSRTTVQQTWAYQTDRDWRYSGYILPVQFLQLKGVLQTEKVLLSWQVIADKEVDHFEVERSINNSTYIKTGTVTKTIRLNTIEDLAFTDDITNVNSEIIYYRIKVIGKAGEIQYSNILVIRKQLSKTDLSIVPNPAKDNVFIAFVAEKESVVTIRLIDDNGKLLLLQDQKVTKGNNTIQLTGLGKYCSGIYIIQVYVNNQVVIKKLILMK